MPDKFQSMFSSAFAGWAEEATIEDTIRVKMKGAPVQAETLTKLMSTMKNLQSVLDAPGVIDRGNVFEVNARTADAYKAAYDTAEKAYAEIYAQIDREAEAKRPGRLTEIEKSKVTRLRSKSKPNWFERRRIRKYDEADLKFKSEREKITAKYAAPMANLGAQMQTMAVNRGYIAATTQRMFDAMQLDPTATVIFKGTFNEQMAGTKLINAERTQDTAGGRINELYRTQISEKDLYVKQGSMYLDGKRDTLRAEQAIDLRLVDPDAALVTDSSRHVLAINESAFRDQGTFIVSKLMGSDVIVPTRLGTDATGGFVSIMDAAPGTEGDLCIIAASAREAEELKRRGQTLRNKCEKHEVPIPEAVCAPVIDLSHSSLQAQALQMSAIDYVCGQTDRHSGNFCVAEVQNRAGSSAGSSTEHAKLAGGVRYKLTGIDNDGAFPSVNLSEYGKGVPTLRQSIPFVTPELVKQVDALNADETVKALKGVVDRGPVGEQVLQGVRTRIGELKAHVHTVPVILESEMTPETSKQLQVSNSPLGHLGGRVRISRERFAEAELEARKQIDATYVEVDLGPEPVAAPSASISAPPSSTAAAPLAPVPPPLSPTL